ncbi:hypothetical protein E1B28_011461 [Marasmius oreades]|uniref:DUF1295-domain-containing protein n=1 Tax=Marasmius oreades TaxID=181124 RepID=A0A9P7RUR7_9AGAR|nr:uncharacterized protein E1B28_011461 [Marasmius oreades]KAG7089812.1 hypothetical protein E1B28_011461 [Marasmius oreades]
MLSLAAFEWPLQFCAFVTITSYIASIITSNVSQVDRLWNFLPPIYTAYFALLPLWPSTPLFPLFPFVPKELSAVAKDYSPRAVMMLSLVLLWMCRLGYNTYRRGLFNLHDEDYRWAVLRTQMSPFLFQVLNLVFISGIQNVLLLLLGIPSYIAVCQPHTELTTSDYLCGGISLALLTFEFIADNQQYSYHSFKHAYLGKSTKYDEANQWPGARLKWTSEDAQRGFVTKGLWAYSRHPNFACEQSFWWAITLVPVIAPVPPFLPHHTFPQIWAFLTNPLARDLIKSNPSLFKVFLAPFSPLLPAVSYSLLFLSSTPYTENISLSKYPVAYAAYKERVGMFSPLVTFEKGLWLKLTQGDEKKRQLDGLVYGTAKGKAKAE